MSIVRVGLAGVKGHGAVLLEAVTSCPNLSFVACHDVDAEAMERKAERHGCAIFEDYSSMIGSDEVDAVILATPNHLHYDQVIEALEIGKDVFVEKPLCGSVAEALDIKATALRNGRVLQVGFNARKFESTVRLRQILSEESIGEPVACEAHFSYDAGMRNAIADWKRDPRKCPLLPLTQLGSHLVDLLMLILGEVDFVFTGSTSLRMQTLTGSPLIDSTAVLMKFDSGILATLHAHYLTPEVYELKLFGTEGSITWTPGNVTLEIVRQGVKKKMDYRSMNPPQTSFRNELTEFANCILKRERPEADADTGLKQLIVHEALVRSADTGKLVSIKDILRVNAIA